MSFPPELERLDLSTHAVRFSWKNLGRALLVLPFGGPFPKTGTFRKDGEVKLSDGGPKSVDHVSPDVVPGDHVIVFTQGARPKE